MTELSKFSELDYMVLKIGLCSDLSDEEIDELLEEYEKRKSK